MLDMRYKGHKHKDECIFPEHGCNDCIYGASSAYEEPCKNCERLWDTKDRICYFRRDTIFTRISSKIIARIDKILSRFLDNFVDSN
jgi:hypothetical protein